MVKTEEIDLKDMFINLDINKLPLSLFIIRSRILLAIKELKPKLKGNIVDLACGEMPYKTYLWNPQVNTYIGIDIEPSVYHNTVKPDLFWDGKNIPLENSSCDFVIATEFLEHYFDTGHLLTEVRRILKPGGCFFFTVPHIWPIHESPYDYHRFLPSSLEMYFKNAKFSKWEIKPLGGYNVSLALLISLFIENNISNRTQRLIRPLIHAFIKYLIKRDKCRSYENNSFYSGFYGFTSK